MQEIPELPYGRYYVVASWGLFYGLLGAFLTTVLVTDERASIVRRRVAVKLPILGALISITMLGLYDVWAVHLAMWFATTLIFTITFQARSLRIEFRWYALFYSTISISYLFYFFPYFLKDYNQSLRSIIWIPPFIFYFDLYEE